MSNNALEVIEEKVGSVLEKYPAVVEHLEKASTKTGVKKERLVLGALVVIPTLLLFLCCGGDIFIDLAGYAYPMYGSIKAVESGVKEDDKFWLTYWLIFAIFKVLEGFADFVISFIPFYFLLKAAFLVWCYYPSTQGAKLIYAHVLKAHVVPHLKLNADEKKDN